MMYFKINLIKNKVIPLKKRRVIFFVMASYLSICGVLLASLCYSITANFININNQRRDIMHLEEQLHLFHPEQKDIIKHTQDMKSKMVKYAEKIDTIEEILSESIDLAHLVQRFSTPLPSGAYIDNFNLNGKTRVLNFDVVMPADEIGDAFNNSTSELISAWKEDASLMGGIEDIKSSSSRRQNRDEKSFFISKFYCNLSK